MKMNKKKLAVVSLVLCITAIISMGSLAWFTSEDSIVNNLNFVTDFEVDVIEHDEEGNEVGTGSTTTGLTFDNLVPNQTVDKDPTVRNKSATEDQWIKMTVTVSNGDKWLAYLGENASLEYLFRGYDDTLWVHPDDPSLDESNNMVATFYLAEPLEAGQEVTLFDQVHIYEGIDVATAKTLTGTKITINAKAIQTSELSADSCVEAFGIVEGAN